MDVTEIEIDGGNEAHVTRHGISVTEVLQVFANRPHIKRNRQGRAATHVARGRTFGGRLVLIPFVALGGGRIRPVAAWEVGR